MPVAVGHHPRTHIQDRTTLVCAWCYTVRLLPLPVRADVSGFFRAGHAASKILNILPAAKAQRRCYSSKPEPGFGHNAPNHSATLSGYYISAHFHALFSFGSKLTGSHLLKLPDAFERATQFARRVWFAQVCACVASVSPRSWLFFPAARADPRVRIRTHDCALHAHHFLRRCSRSPASRLHLLRVCVRYLPHALPRGLPVAFTRRFHSARCRVELRARVAAGPTAGCTCGFGALRTTPHL